MLKAISKYNNKKYDGVIKFTPEAKELVTKDNDKYTISYPSNYSQDYEYLYDLVLNDLKKVIVDDILKNLSRDKYGAVISVLINLESVNNMSLFYNYIGDFLNKLDYDLLAIDVYMPLEDKYGKLLGDIYSPVKETNEEAQELKNIRPIRVENYCVSQPLQAKMGRREVRRYKVNNDRKKLIKRLKKEKDLPPNIEEYLKELELEDLYDSLDIDSDMFVKPKANDLLLYQMQSAGPRSNNDKINKKYNQMIKEMNEAANKSKNLGEYITSLLKAKGLKQAELAFMTGIDPSLISKLVGKNNVDSYNAKKDTLALVAFGLELRVTEAKRLFELGGFVLRPREAWDKVVLFVLENAEKGEFDYDINIVNTYLQRLGMDIITTRNYKERNR